MLSTEEEYLLQFNDFINSVSPISDASFEKLKSIAVFRSIDSKEYILRIGQIAKKRYFVCNGILISEYVTEEGNRHIKNLFTEGIMAGSTASALQELPSQFAIQALEKTDLLEFGHQDYKQLIKENDDLKDFYIAHLEKSWILKNERRHMAFATQTSMERYQTFRHEYPELENRISLTHIASYLGITPTQLSRIRNAIKK